MSRRRRASLGPALVVLVVLGAASTHGLEPDRRISQYRWQQWAADEGLPQSSVLALHQGSDGYLWFGTEEGLVRFDGIRFTVFDRRDHPAMASHIVTSLAEAGDALWVGTPQGLLRRGPTGDRWWTIESGLPSDRVQALLTDRHGRLWVGTLDGLVRIAPGTAETTTIERDTYTLGGTSIQGLVEGPDGELWIATEVGLLRRRDDQVEHFDVEHGLPDPWVSAVLPDAEGAWVGTHAGLCRFADGRCRPVRGHATVDAPDVQALARDRAGHLWIGTNGHGLSRLDLDSGRLDSMPPDDPFAWTLVRGLAVDDDDQLWVGTAGAGLLRLADVPFEMWGEREGLPTDRVLTALEDSRGRLWLGTLGGGLVRLGDDSIEVVTTADGLSTENVWSLYEDRHGDLWLGTYGGGIDRLSAAGTIDSFGAADGLENPFVRAFQEDADGTLWAATRGGLHRRVGDRFERVAGTEIFGVDDVYSLHLDPTGTLWIGSREGVLARRTATGFERFAAADGVPDGRVYTIEDATGGGLWLATSDGLGRFRDGVVQRLGSRDGLHDDRIFTVVPDGRGDLWMTSNRGIFRAAEADLLAVVEGRRERVATTAYGVESGLRDREGVGGAQPAGFRLADGRLVFPTVAGLARVDPAALGEAPPPPTPRIESLRVDDATRPVANTTAIEIAPGTDLLEVAFTAPTFVDPERLRFRYRLEGYTDSWTDAGTRRFAQFTRVPPGSYRFDVATRRPDGEWSPPATVELTFTPRFHQTWTFRAAGLILLVLAAYGLHRWQVRQLRRREEMLAEHVQRAVAEIRKLEGLLPICAQCKKIRDDEGHWNDLEGYLSEHTAADFSHGLCPDCVADLYRELDETT